MYVFQGVIGQKIILDVGINIDVSTTRQIKYEKSDGTSSYWSAAKEGSTGISFTTALATDLDKKGNWKLQAYVVTPTWENYGDIVRLEVRETL